MTQFANHVRVAQGGKSEVTIHFSYVEEATEHGDQREAVASITMPFDVWLHLGEAAAGGYAKSDGEREGKAVSQRPGDGEGDAGPGDAA